MLDQRGQLLKSSALGAAELARLLFRKSGTSLVQACFEWDTKRGE